MRKHLNRHFNDFPNEAELISIILAGYNELEFDLLSLLGTVLEDSNMAVRILYRLCSESHRLDVADAILRDKCETAGIQAPYGCALGALRWCKNLRNQYAHSHWHESNGLLQFFNMEELAKSAKGDTMLSFKPVDVALLEKQVEFLRHTARWLMFLRESYTAYLEKAPNHDLEAPPQLLQPKMHNLQT